MFLGMYPELRSSMIFAAVTLEAIHLLPAPLLVIAGEWRRRSEERQMRSRLRLEAKARRDVGFTSFPSLVFIGR
jgi:hypothetical protein